MGLTAAIPSETGAMIPSVKEVTKGNLEKTEREIRQQEEAMDLENRITMTRISVALISINSRVKERDIISSKIIHNRASIKIEKLKNICAMISEIIHLMLQLMIHINFHILEEDIKTVSLEIILVVDIKTERRNNILVVIIKIGSLTNIPVVDITIERVNNNFEEDIKTEKPRSNSVLDIKIENLKNNFMVDIKIEMLKCSHDMIRIHLVPQMIVKIIFLILKIFHTQVTFSTTFLMAHHITKVIQVLLEVIKMASCSRKFERVNCRGSTRTMSWCGGPTCP